LPVIIDELDLSNLQGGLLQSAFIVSYVVVAPLVGYLGDRFSRK
jgi:MFS family permease